MIQYFNSPKYFSWSSLFMWATVGIKWQRPWVEATHVPQFLHPHSHLLLEHTGKPWAGFQSWVLQWLSVEGSHQLNCHTTLWICQRFSGQLYCLCSHCTGCSVIDFSFQVSQFCSSDWLQHIAYTLQIHRLFIIFNAIIEEGPGHGGEGYQITSKSFFHAIFHAGVLHFLHPKNWKLCWL